MNIKFLEYTLNVEYPKWPIKNQMIINTINPHSYCVAKNDEKFKTALQSSDILIPDGIGIVYATRILKNIKIPRITGTDMHKHLLEEAHKNKLKVFYLGASNSTLQKIQDRLLKQYPSIRVAYFSPPFKSEFSEEDNAQMVTIINQFSPDILFVGMTAPKQEKWVFCNKHKLNSKMIASVGAVFDFYAGSMNRAPNWIQALGLEWMHRFVKNPKKMWRRYLINNTKFIWFVIYEKWF